jgi:hypothetical protein
MDQNSALYQSLRDQINLLEKRCATLERDLYAMCRRHEAHADWCAEYFKLSGQEIADTNERVDGLENKVFPQMQRIRKQVRKIVGPEETPYDNPLDRKKT